MWRGSRRDERCQIDVGAEGRELVDALIGVTPAVNRKQVAVEAIRSYARMVVGKDPKPSLQTLADLVAEMDANQIRPIEILPQSLGSVAATPSQEAAIDAPLVPANSEPGRQSNPAPSDPLAVMRDWVNNLSDEPPENGTSAEDWQRLKQRVSDVARQVARLMEHGWSLRGLFGWPSGLVAQAYNQRCTFTSLHNDGRVVR